MLESEEVDEFLPELDWLLVNQFVEHVKKMATQRVEVREIYLRAINDRSGGKPVAISNPPEESPTINNTGSSTNNTTNNDVASTSEVPQFGNTIILMCSTLNQKTLHPYSSLVKNSALLASLIRSVFLYPIILT